MSTISILNQIIDDEEGAYRIRFGKRVGYVTIPTDAFDEDTMYRLHLLIPKLPALPKDGWTRIKIVRPSVDAPLEIIATNHPLPEVETVWHPDRIDVLSLEQTKCHRSNVHEVLYDGIPAISKIAAFDWQDSRLERETWGEFASADDLPACSSTPGRLHEIGLVHGDANCYNFIVDKQSR